PTTRPTANARPRAACRADPRLRVLQRRARPGRLVQMAGSRADPCVRFRRDHDVTKSQRAVAMPLQISFAVTNHLSSREEQASPKGPPPSLMGVALRHGRKDTADAGAAAWPCCSTDESPGVLRPYVDSRRTTEGRA